MSSWAWPLVGRCASVIRVSSAWSQSGAARAVVIWVLREEVAVGVAAFDQPVGVEQQPVAG